MIGTWSHEVMAKACGKSRRSRWLTGDVGIQATALMAHRNFWPISVGGHPEHLLSVQGVCIYTCYRYSVYNVYNMYIVHIIIICVHVYIYMLHVCVIYTYTHHILCLIMYYDVWIRSIVQKVSAEVYTERCTTNIPWLTGDDDCCSGKRVVLHFFITLVVGLDPQSWGRQLA